MNPNYDLAWAAGFFDGEGSLSITYQQSIHAFGTDVQITQVSKKPLERLVRMFGGYLYLRKRDAFVNSRDTWLWRLRGKDSEYFVRAIYPYLFLKKEQAGIFLRMRESIRTHKACRRRPIPKAEFSKRMVYLAKMKDLNKRGL